MASLRSHFFRFVVKHYVAPKFSAATSVADLRSFVDKIGKRAGQPADLKVEAITVGDTFSEWISAGVTSENRAILYLHGGGYVVGSPIAYRDLAGRISKATGIRVLLLDYRLAPEHPYPAALQDATLAYRWLLEQGFSKQNIIIAGDSAGAGLALATLISLRDNGVPCPALAVCISPWTDLSLSQVSLGSNGQKFQYPDPDWLKLTAHYYADDHDPKTPLISPVYANLQGLPPMLIQVGRDEVLLSDSRRFEERSRDAGVKVTLTVWDALWHVWHIFGQLPETRRALEEIATFVEDNLKNSGV